MTRRGAANYQEIPGCELAFGDIADALAAYSEAALAFVEDRPAWATVAFALAVSGGALGCLMLLLWYSKLAENKGWTNL
jgi:hypothetical protein